MHVASKIFDMFLTLQIGLSTSDALDALSHATGQSKGGQVRIKQSLFELSICLMHKQKT